MNIYIYICIYISLFCAAKPRSRHRAMRMNVAKQKSKYMRRKCITFHGEPRKGGKRKPEGATGSQRGAKREPDGAKRVPK